MKIIGLLKFYRFFQLYGFYRAYTKSIGRLRIIYTPSLPFRIFSKKQTVGIIGCGQFSFSTLGFFLRKFKGNIIKKCYDINNENSLSFSKYYKCKSVPSVNEIFNDQQIELIYIASNHATHTHYALSAIDAKKNVFIEKPLCTSFDQFEQLNSVVSRTTLNVYAGYNRPYSKAILELIKHLPSERKPITLTCFVLGHVLLEDHWYRKPEEGTRVCGNLGHWIDLTVHIMNRYKMPNIFNISICYSDESELDDNINVCVTTDKNDLITYTLTARSEPFEGINESINLQTGNLITKIDDFRKLDIWKDELRISKKYLRKDVGHALSTLQPFIGKNRPWEELKIGTLLMLFIADMVKNKNEKGTFTLDKYLEKFQ